MRMELQVALEVLGHHLSNLAVDDERLAWTASHTVRSLKTLPLTRIPHAAPESTSTHSSKRGAVWRARSQRLE